jgi:ribosomal protein S18 acetylase RimI-like enzyme
MMHLQTATLQDLQTVLTWIETPEQLKRWGGPLLTWPPQAGLTWRQIEADTHQVFALVSDAGDLAGLGQTLRREENAVHLGRIILSPALRGKGVGLVLMQNLIDKGRELYHPQYFSLYVYNNNLPAVRLYRSMGFTVTETYEEDDSCRMELRFDEGMF